jgi:molybdopterin adenylyltransferase
MENVEVRAVVITVSDRCARGEQEDKSGAALAELLQEMGAKIVATEIVPDDLEPLARKLRGYADRADVNLVLTTGGTGVAPRDNTPEATRAVIQKEAPGLAEAMRIETLSQTPMAMISRGVCGIRSGALIINLPGSPTGVRACFAVIKPVLPHAIALLAGKPHSEAESGATND